MGHWHRKSHHKDVRRERIEELTVAELLTDEQPETEEDGNVSDER
jgi:hypothetical protein